MAETTQLEALIRTAKKNDDRAARELYEHLIDRVYAYVRYRTGSDTEATDLTQDIFIDLFRSLSGCTYQSDAQFYSFVFTISKRKLAKHYASKNTEAALSRVDVDVETLTANDAAEPETADALKRALTTLDGETREIVVLHHWSRYSFAEIATLVGSTEGAVRTRHHRALKHLAATLTDHSS